MTAPPPAVCVGWNQGIIGVVPAPDSAVLTA
jgi:hypothetical protein